MNMSASGTSQDDMLTTPKEVSRQTGVPERTLASWRTQARAQPLAFLKVGRLVRYRRADVLAFIEAGLVQPASKA